MHTAEDLIESISGLFPDHRRGTRPIHSTGIAARGSLEPTEAATRFTNALPLTTDGRVTVRFSNGSGDHGAPDTRRDPRGMAVRFHGQDGEATFDMICVTVRVFFVKSVEAFQEFLVATRPPDPPVVRSRWRDVIDALHLRSVPVDPLPGDDGALDFADAHPETCPALVQMRNERVPESYAARSYHPIHAYRLTASDGSSRFVRFHWEPTAGVRNRAVAPGDDRCMFLHDDLRQRVRDGSVQFVLRAQVAEQGDDTADPSRPWPQTRRRIVLGHLTVHGPVLDEAEAEALAFNPHTLPPGVAPDPDDEIFAVRGEVYRTSAAARSAEGSVRG